MRKRDYLVGAATLAIVTGTPNSTYAQTAPTAAAEESTEIIVTARRRAESLIDVPIAINALGEGSIVEKGVNSVDKVAQLTPGLQMDRGFSPAEIRPSLRGIALTEGRSNVAIIVDGVDVTGVSLNTILGGSGAQTAAALMDLERIEVVKGPQTVYFGRSAFAGAIQFISREPSFTTGAKVDGALGDRGRREITAHITGPVIADTLAVKLSGTYRNFNGYYENPGDGRNLGGTRTYGIGGSALLKTGALKLKTQLSYLRDHIQPNAGYIAPRANTTLFGVNYIGEKEFDQSQIGISTNTDYYGYKAKTWRGVINGELELGSGFTLNAITGYNRTKGSIKLDFDNKPDNVPTGTVTNGIRNCVPAICVGIFDSDTSLRQLSQEIRLNYDSGPFHALIGGYYFDENYTEVDYTRFVGSQSFVTGTRSNIPGRPSSLFTNTYSGFGSLEYEFADAFTLTGELRYNHEKIRAEAATLFNALVSSGSAAINFRGKTSFDAWLPRVSARYKITPDTNVYATISKGSKPGGFNTGAVADSVRPFGQEKIWTYELGTKGRFFDRRLTLDAAVYYSDWRNIQVTTVCFGQNSPFGPEAQCPAFAGITTNYIINAKKATVKGLELGAALKATDWVTFDVNYAYTDSKYKDFLARDVFPAVAGATPRQFGGNRVQWIPKHSISGSTRFEAPVMDDGTKGFLEVSGRYRSGKYVRFDNRVRLDAKAVFDTQFGLKGDGWSASVFVDNIFNDTTPDFSRYYGNWNPNRTNGEYIVAPPKRAFGVRASKEF